MIETHKNPQIIYMDPRNAMGLAMGLMTFGYQQFSTTKRMEKLPEIKKLCEEQGADPRTNMDLMYDLAFNGLLDSIKITVCFENFFKALLISNGYVIHKLNKDIFPDLSKQQYLRPISVKEVLDVRDWEVINSIDLPEEWMKRQIKGMSKHTIGMKELLAPGNVELLKIPENILKICEPYFQYRNNLHLYAGEMISFTKTDYSDFTKVIDFINIDLVRIQNAIIDTLNKGKEYKLRRIIYS